MAKVNLLHFEIFSLLDESKKLIEFLQKLGITEFENVVDEELLKYQTDYIVEQFKNKAQQAENAFGILEKYCELKKSFLESFNDCSEISYNEYRLIADKSDELLRECLKISDLSKEIDKLKAEINETESRINYYKPWMGLDIPMASKRTLTTDIFIGTFPREISSDEIKGFISDADKEIDDIEIQVISSQKMLTCAVIMCHRTSADKVSEILRNNGFIIPDKLLPKLPEKAIEEFNNKISSLQKKEQELKDNIKEYSSFYKEIRYLYDYYIAQADKYSAVENAATTENVFYIKGYLPERYADEVKFEIERQFTAHLELYPIEQDEDAPVLIENKSFAAGVESITNMYSPPSHKDLDPNPVMSFFYYAFFGLMLSDAGYGLLMVIFALVARFKIKVKGNMKKSADMVLYCGISTVIWGALFGGWFGDLIPTVCTNFLGYENPPRLALWLEPMNNSMELLMFCFIFGIIHLFAGLFLRFYMLMKEKNYIGAILDVIPVCIFVIGFAIAGGSFIFTIPEKVKSAGFPLLAVGSLLIVLTAGRSSKNILGKLGGGLYALYNAASGYLGDILSYSRLLALSLVTGVIANVVNLLGAMFGNVFIFIIVFIFGHTVNLAINLIGTYVHTNRLQYVEFFSKFYEGSGRLFSPFKINSKFFTIKEENKYG